MNVREQTQQIERLTLAPWASFSDASRGRARPEPQDPIRPAYQRDRDRYNPLQGFPPAETKDAGLPLAGRNRTVHG